MDARTQRPKGLHNDKGEIIREDLAKLWDNKYRGWERGPETWNENEGGPDDIHLYGHGKLEATFQVDLMIHCV